MINHTECQHPGTPAARKACRKAFAAIRPGDSLVLADGSHVLVHNIYDGEFQLAIGGLGRKQAPWLVLRPCDIAAHHARQA